MNKMGTWAFNKKLVYNIAFIFFGVQLNAQTQSVNTKINISVSSKKENQNYKIIIRKFQPDTADNDYKISATAYLKSSNTSIDYDVTEPHLANLEIYRNDTMVNGSSLICTKGTINIEYKQQQNELVVSGGENNFYFENQLLLFELPAIIFNDNKFEIGSIKSQYDLDFSTSPILKFRYVEYERNIKKIVQANKEKYFILYRLWERRGYISTKTLEECFELLSADLRNTAQGVRMKDYIDNSKKMFVGQRLPYFQIKDVNGTDCLSTNFSDSSKYTLIHFWATWCVPCIQQMKSIATLVNQTQRQNFQVVSISFDSDKARWLNYIKKDSVFKRHYIETEAFKSELANLFGITSIPKNILIDNKGIILAVDYDKNKIQELLKALPRN